MAYIDFCMDVVTLFFRKDWRTASVEDVCRFGERLRVGSFPWAMEAVARQGSSEGGSRDSGVGGVPHQPPLLDRRGPNPPHVPGGFRPQGEGPGAPPPK